MNRFRFFTVCTLCAFMLLFAVGCSNIILGGASLGAYHLGLFQNPDVNLKAKSYAAADYIIQQADTFIRSGDIIVMKPLVNYEDGETPSNIGRIIPEDIGTRLIQLGYNVDTREVAEVPFAPPAKMGKPDYILSGHYKNDRPNLYVGLRLTEIATGRSVGAFDYVMPTNREIRSLSEPTPQIIHITK